MMRASVFRLSPLLLLAAALMALAVFMVGDPQPASADHELTTTVLDTPLTQSSDTSYLGCNNNTSGMECTSYLRDDEFTYDGVTYAVIQVGVGNSVTSIVFDKAVPTSWRSGATLWLHGQPFRFEDASISNSGKTFAWGDFGTTWGSGNTVWVSLKAPTPPFWSATLTVGTVGATNLGYHYSATAGALSDRSFTYGGVDYEIERLDVVIASGALQLFLNKTISGGLEAGILNVGGRQFELANATLAANASVPNGKATWNNSGLSWSAGDTVSLSLRGPALPYGVVLSAETLTLVEGGDASIFPNTFTVALAKDPGTDKTVHLVKTQFFGQYGAGSGVVWDQNAATVSPESLTFTAGSSGNWATAQEVTVTPVDDDDGCQDQLIILVLEGTSGDYTPVGGAFNSVTGVSVSVIDDDTSAPCGGGVQGSDGGEAQPTAVTLSLDAATVSEDAGDVTLTVNLDAPAPEGGIGGFLFAGDDGTATADVDFTLPFSIFIPGGERSATATVSITDDDLDEADETVVMSALFDMGTALLEDKITLTITDDDTAGVTVTAAIPLSVDEGSTATYTVVLDSRPTADVTITPSSSDTDAATVSPASHTFTPSTWNNAATFTVSGAADTDTNNESASISHGVTSDDAKYAAALLSSVSVSVTDTTTGQQGQAPEEVSYDDLIAKVKEWRNDQRYAHDKRHTDRWDRVLLALGETVSDASLTVMTADEAQGYADRGWTRWVEVAEALRELESAGQQDPANSAPTVASAIADVTIVNESGTQTVSLSGVFTDADSDALTVTNASSNEAVATVSVAADYSILTVTAKSRGTATITVTADDGNGGTAEDAFTVKVKAAPVVASALADVSMEEEENRDISLSGVFSDADGDSLTITVASSDAAVDALEFQGTLTLVAVSAGTSTITVTAQDSDGNAVSDSFDVTVTAPQQPEQDPPPEQEQGEEASNGTLTVSAPLDDISLQGPAPREIALDGVFSGDDLTITAASSNYGVASVWVDGSTLTVVGTGTGTATITVTAQDADGNTVSDEFEVTVSPAS